MSSLEYEQSCEKRFVSFCTATIFKAFQKILRELYRYRDRELSISALSEKDESALQSKLCIPAARFRVQRILVEIYDDELANALKRICQRQREIVLLYYLLGFSDKEIAGQLGLSASTVRYHRKTALAQLKQIMEERL